MKSTNLIVVNDVTTTMVWSGQLGGTKSMAAPCSGYRAEIFAREACDVSLDSQNTAAMFSPKSQDVVFQIAYNVL